MRPSRPQPETMNDIIAAMGLETWKPVVSTLLLPPVPLLLLILVGARLMYRRRLIAWLLILTGVTLTWFSATTAAGKLLRPVVMNVPKVLPSEVIADLKLGKGPNTAIVVLGAGRRTLAPEYGLSTLNSLSMERLRYGLWLARETGLPVVYSGGVGHGARSGPTEAEIAARIAEREFGRPLRWIEDRSRDTAESGILTVPKLQEAGVSRVVLVTTDLHQPRALRAYERGAQRSGKPLTLLAAPVGVPTPFVWSWADFVPTAVGFADTRILVHEWIGYWLGA